MGQSEIVETEKVQIFNTLKSGASPDSTNKKDAKYNLKLAKNSIDTGISLEARAIFFELIKKFSDVFSKNEWDFGLWDVTAHKIQV